MCALDIVGVISFGELILIDADFLGLLLELRQLHRLQLHTKCLRAICAGVLDDESDDRLFDVVSCVCDETMVRSRRSKHFGIFTISGSSFASPSGRTHFRKGHPNTQI